MAKMVALEIPAILASSAHEMNFSLISLSTTLKSTFSVLALIMLCYLLINI